MELVEQAVRGNKTPELVPISGKLGYPVEGTFIVIPDKEPSKYYVRFPDGSFAKIPHFGHVQPTPNLDVEIAFDERNKQYIKGLLSAVGDASVLIYGPGVQSSGVSAFADLTDVDTVDFTAGNVPIADGTKLDMVPLGDVAVLHDQIAGDPTGYVVKTGTHTYEAHSLSSGAGWFPNKCILDTDEVIADGAQIVINKALTITTGSLTISGSGVLYVVNL